MVQPALALLEYDSVAAGLRAADAMLKRAPVASFKAGTVHPGRFLVLVGGTVAAVEEAWQTGIDEAPGFLLDEVFLPDVHPEVAECALGARHAPEHDALGVLETHHVASLLRAADVAVKGAAIRIAEIRLADELGGRAFVLFDGPLTEVQTAIELGESRLGPDRLHHQTILPRLEPSVRRLVGSTTRFASAEVIAPEGAEIAPAAATEET